MTRKLVRVTLAALCAAAALALAAWLTLVFTRDERGNEAAEDAFEPHAPAAVGTSPAEFVDEEIDPSLFVGVRERPPPQAEPLARGLVVDEGGAPLEGAEVAAMPIDSFEREAPTLPDLLSASDASGAFAFAPPEGGYWLVVRKEGFVPALRDGIARGEDVVVVLERASSTTLEVVSAADGAPIAGAMLSLRVPGAYASARTDASGRATLPRPRRAVRLHVAAEGFREFSGRWPAPADATPARLALEPLAHESIHVRVLDEESGGIRDAVFEHGPFEHVADGLYRASARMDADGFMIAVRAPGRQARWCMVPHGAHDAAASPATVVLARAARCEGVVLAQDGLPLPHARVRVSATEARPTPGVSHELSGEADTDATGGFAIDHLRIGREYEVSAGARGFAATTVRWTAGDGAPLRLRLEPQAPLFVSAHDENGTRLRLRRVDASASFGGRLEPARVDLLPDGTARVHAGGWPLRLHVRAAGAAAVTRELPSFPEDGKVDVRLPREARLRVRVLLPDGSAAVNAAVELRAADPKAAGAKAFCDAGGDALFEGLAAGRHTLRAEHGLDAAPRADVDLLAGATQELLLRLVSPTGVLFDVRGPDGSPWRGSGALDRLYADGRGGWRLAERVGCDLRLDAFVAVAPAKPTRLELHVAGFSPARSEALELREGETRALRLDLLRPRVCVARVHTEEGHPLRGVRLVLLPREAGRDSVESAQSDGDGAIDLATVPPGTYGLRALHVAGTLAAGIDASRLELDVAPNELDVPAQGELRAELVVRLGRGAPAELELTGDVAGAAAVRLTLRNEDGRTHALELAAGTTRIPFLPAGTWRLSASAWRDGRLREYELEPNVLESVPGRTLRTTLKAIAK